MSATLSTKPIRARHVLTFALLAGITAVILAPLLWMVSFSLRTNTDLVASPGFFPTRITFENYVTMWSVAPFGIFFRNSLMIGIGVATVTVVLSSGAGYALSRFRFRGRKFVRPLLTFSQILPVVILIVPMYLLARGLGLYNTQFGLGVVYVGITLPFATLMMLGFFNQLPPDMEEAALVDGATRLQAFWYVALPLVRPGIISVAVFAFIATWEEFVLALTLTNRTDVRTLPIGFTYFFQQYQTNYTGLMAASVVSCIPVLILFMAIGQYFVRGISSGGVKG